MLMHPRDRGVDGDHPLDLTGGVSELVDLGEQSLPGTVSGPPVEPLVDRVPLPEPLRNVPPRRAGAVLPHHALERATVIRPRPTRRLDRRQHRLQHSPHLIRNLATRHEAKTPRTAPRIP